MFRRTKGTRGVPNALSYHIYYNYSHGPWKVYFVYTYHFLISPRYYSTYGGSKSVSFYGNVNDCYHEFYSIGNSFHDHVLIHGFGIISHSLKGMVWIKLDCTGNF